MKMGPSAARRPMDVRDGFRVGGRLPSPLRVRVGVLRREPNSLSRASGVLRVDVAREGPFPRPHESALAAPHSERILRALERPLGDACRERAAAFEKAADSAREALNDERKALNAGGYIEACMELESRFRALAAQERAQGEGGGA